MNLVSVSAQHGTICKRSRLSLLKLPKPSFVGTSSTVNAPGMSFFLFTKSNIGSSWFWTTLSFSNALSA